MISVQFLVGCASAQETCEVDILDLGDLLISENDLPTTSWSVSGPSNVVIDRERSDDLIWIGFFSDLYPTYLGTIQQVFRYQSIQEAERDYNYSVNYYRDSYFPDGWTFQSEVANESYIGCEQVSPNVSFPMCYWIARYDCIVIEFSPWLISDRMTLDDMETIVNEIDQKASELIQNE